MRASVPLSSIPPWAGEIHVTSGLAQLDGSLDIPRDAQGLVIFAHGSGSSRHSPRNRKVAQALQNAGLATLLFDLLTGNEEASDALTGHLRFDIEFLAARLLAVTRWAAKDSRVATLAIGYFGASTGAAAALVAAADPQVNIGAVVSRGGRPDLARSVLLRVRTPTLLIVGGDDDAVIPLNQLALDQLRSEKRLVIVPGATHLFEEPGTLDTVAQLAANWFSSHLSAGGAHR